MYAAIYFDVKENEIFFVIRKKNASAEVVSQQQWMMGEGEPCSFGTSWVWRTVAKKSEMLAK